MTTTNKRTISAQDTLVQHLASLWTVNDETQEKLANCKSYEEYAKVVLNDIICINSHNTDVFQRLYGLSKYIPAGMVVRLACEMILPNYRFDKTMLCEMLGKALAYESSEDKEAREAFVRDALKEHIMPNGKIRLYRGATKASFPPQSAFSYSISKEKAEWFQHRNELMTGLTGELITKDFPLNRVLWYTNCRNEQEVIIIPPCLLRFINDAQRARERENARKVC